MGVLLIASPWIFNFAGDGAETWVPVILGIAALMYSLVTAYEFSMVRMISMRTHLTLDLVSGLFLASSPWIFNFDEYVYIPHLVLGVVEVVASLLTEKKSFDIHSRNYPKFD